MAEVQQLTLKDSDFVVAVRSLRKNLLIPPQDKIKVSLMMKITS